MRVMTSRDRDWIDEVLDDEEVSGWQIGIIEGLLITSSAQHLYNNINISELTYIDAEKIIEVLRENNCPTDPKDQFRSMSKAGVFK